MILVIDHYDSFVENLARMVREIMPQYDTHIVAQDTELESVLALNPAALILSPGPGTPDNSGISRAVVAHFKGQIPILGVCLGHQIIADVFGGTIEPSPTPRHGKSTFIHHQGAALFKGIASGFEAGLYHSLSVKTLPPDFIMIASNDKNHIMAIAHKDLPIMGVQFHPESILTPDGKIIMRNFLEMIDDKNLV